MCSDVSTAAASTPEDEFRSFVIRHQAALQRLALVVSGDPGMAEDLVQTALMRTFARWSRFRGEEPSAYARKVIVNANIDRWRRVRGREHLTDTVPDDPHQGPSDGIEDRQVIVRALVDLSPIERRVIALRFLFDMSEGAVAEDLGIPVGTVKSTTHRAVRKLRESGKLSDLNGVSS